MCKIRAFKEEYIGLILKLLIENLTFDSFSVPLLREKILEDPDYDPELVLTCWEGDSLTGFMQGLIREADGEKTAFLKLFAVSAAHRHKGIAKNLYEILDEKFRNSGVKSVKITTIPDNYYMPGIDSRYSDALAFIRSLGFSMIAESMNLVVTLQEQNFDTTPDERNFNKQNYYFSRVTYEQRDEIISFLAENFKECLKEGERVYFSYPVSMHIVREGNKIAGFAAHNTNNFGSGWFGPAGVIPEIKSRDLDVVLLKRCLQDMKEWEMNQAVIPDVTKISFYEAHAMAKEDRKFIKFEKKL
ncbi:MAG: GNAT family N-acetyltransferase [Calditrichaceae bacterium]